jgi:hypothetical protein
MSELFHAQVPTELGDTVQGGHKLDREDLNHLVQQLEFLDSSCAAFDAGSLAEAKRLATTVRVLLHDTRSSTSLLQRLGLKASVPWADGVVDAWLKDVIREQDAGHLMSISMLTTIKLGVGFLENHDLVKYVPVFEVQDLGERWAPFDYWWTTTRIVDDPGEAWGPRRYSASPGRYRSRITVLCTQRLLWSCRGLFCVFVLLGGSERRRERHGLQDDLDCLGLVDVTFDGPNQPLGLE